MRSIVIAGSLAQKPGRGGHTWVFLQYLLGFSQLGWDVLFVDRLEPDMCVDAAGRRVPAAESWNVRYFTEVLCRFGLEGRFALLCDAGTTTIGLSRLASAQRRVFLDIDPGFGQMWRTLGLHDPFRDHDAYVTIAENMGQPSCPIPTCGLDWITTRQPVVLHQWPSVGSAGGSRPITSVVSWRGAYGPVTYEGKTYGLRAREFRKFAALPLHCDGRFELALDIHPADDADVALLRSHGWSLVTPQDVAGDPWCYREYIRRSAAELMIAKGMYVETNSGWVSDRSICYLASGRPVLAQDTGLANLLPTTEGLVTFVSCEQAIDAVRAVRREPARHQRAARRLAESYFDAAVVLPALVRKLDLN
jgi:hypothetical protein